MKVDFWGQEFEVNMVVGCIGGFFIAVLSSMFGFGGGPFMVPLMSVAAHVSGGWQFAPGNFFQHLGKLDAPLSVR